MRYTGGIALKLRKYAAIAAALCLSLTLFSSACFNTAGIRPFLSVKPLDSEDYAGGYTPSQIRTAYRLGPSNTGKGQTIAIVGAYRHPNLLSDVAVFCKLYKLPKANISVHQMGFIQRYSLSFDPGWALETAMDVEWSHVMAPEANILVVEAASDNTADLLSAINYASKHAKIVSMSWGGDEEYLQTYFDSVFRVPGTVFLASSGDDGAGICWPASSSDVIAVGGTTLSLDESGNRLDETAWEGSGGGISRLEREPQWQKAMNIKTLSSKRSVPDVSFVGDPNTGVSVYCSATYENHSGWFVAGGTSLGAPAWAGILADLNQARVKITNAGSLYNIAGGKTYQESGAFLDISSGDRASSGYDTSTGLGSPDFAKMSANN